MSKKLSEEAKKIIARDIGIPYYELWKKSDEEITAEVEKVTGRKVVWKESAFVKKDIEKEDMESEKC